jgi:hypothetical protein
VIPAVRCPTRRSPPHGSIPSVTTCPGSQGEWRTGRWTFHGRGLLAPVFTAHQRDRYQTTPPGWTCSPLQLDGAKHSRRLLPRLGASVRFRPWPRLALGLAGEPARARNPYAGTGRNGCHRRRQPVSAGGQSCAQAGAATGLGNGARPRFSAPACRASASSNLTAQTGRLFAQNTGALVRQRGQHRARSCSMPRPHSILMRKHRSSARAGWCRPACPSTACSDHAGACWAVMYTPNRATPTPTWRGNLLPGFARHVFLGQTTWRHEGRGFSLLRLTWRGARYSDAANTILRRAPGWSLALAYGTESAERRWSFHRHACRPACAAVRSPPCGRSCDTDSECLTHLRADRHALREAASDATQMHIGIPITKTYSPSFWQISINRAVARSFRS